MENNQKQTLLKVLKWVGVIALLAIILALLGGRKVIPLPQRGFMGGGIEPMPAIRDGVGGVMFSEEVALPEMTSLKSASAPDLKIIKNAYINASVSSVKKTFEALTSLVKENEGYVQNSNIEKISEDKSRGYIELKVPSKNLDTVLNAIGKLDFITEIISQNVSSTDVTRQFVDYEARLKILKTTEQELLKLLGKSGKLGDILEVQRELNNIRTQIETIQSELKFLGSQVDYALVSLNLTEEVPTGIKWKPFVTIKDALQGLVKGLRDFADLLLTFVFKTLLLALLWIAIALLVLKIVLKILKRLGLEIKFDLSDPVFWLKLLGLVIIVLIIIKLFL